MSLLQHTIVAVQRRLWANRFLTHLVQCLAVGAFTFALLFLAQRLFGLVWPVYTIGAMLLGLCVVVALIWTISRREGQLVAAAYLDEAAGLRERVSTARYCAGQSDDPFAGAVVADAERAVQDLRPARLVRFVIPPQWGWALIALVVAPLPALVPFGLLKPAEVRANEEKKAAIESTRVAVKKEMDQIRDLVEKTPALDDLKAKEENPDLGAVPAEQSASDVRHEALKKIDRYEDALRQKKGSDRFDSLTDMRKMMRAIKPPESNEAPTQKLADAMKQGDFTAAKEEIEKLKEQLATLKADEDKEMVEKIGQQLEQLSKQLEQLAVDDKLAKQLEEAGLKKEDLERMLERLSKKDLEQIQKKLEESGVTKEKAESIAKQLQQKQGAKNMAGKMAKSMKDGAQAAKGGDGQSAAAQLSAASDQLSQLEQLEQEMAQLDAAASAMADAKDNIEKQCSKCGGSGKQGDKPCGGCGGKGNGPSQGGMGREPGQGRGGRAEQEQSAVGFKTERQRVHSGKGSIIGQMVYEGEQIPGEASSELSATVAASEREASELIHRDRIPRQYHKAVKAYFSKVKDGMDKKEPSGDAKPETTPDGSKSDAKPDASKSETKPDPAP